MIWGKPQNLKRSLVISHFDGTKFALYYAFNLRSLLFGIPQKLKSNEQYEKIILSAMAILTSFNAYADDQNLLGNSARSLASRRGLWI